MNKMKYLFLFCISLFLLSGCQPVLNKTNQSQLIQKVLFGQESAWNQGNIDAYMAGYWNNDSLKFIGKSGIQYGWKNTLDNYKKSYPDKATMGTLKFNEIKIDVFSDESAFVIGKWQLTREKGNIGGLFTLLFKKINGNWLIVCDHTS